MKMKLLDQPEGKTEMHRAKGQNRNSVFALLCFALICWDPVYSTKTHTPPTISDFGETGSYLTEKLFSALAAS